jgi:Tfp pilus assembly protein PilF
VSLALGKLEEAKADFDKAIAVDPTLDDAMLGRIAIAQKQDRSADAFAIAEAQISKTKNVLTKAKLFEAMGLAQLRQDKITEAAKNLNAAIGLNEDRSRSLSGYAVVLQKQMKPGEAKDVVQATGASASFALRAYRLDSSDAYALAVLSDVYLIRGKADISKKYAKLVVAALPRSNISIAEKSELAKKYNPRAK